jgi:hypothetical protein
MGSEVRSRREAVITFAAVNVGVGRIGPLQGPPQERPQSVPYPSFHCASPARRTLPERALWFAAETAVVLTSRFVETFITGSTGRRRAAG